MPLFWLKEGEVSPYAPEVPDASPTPVDFPLPAGLGRLQEAYARFAEPAGRTAALTLEEIMSRSVVSVDPEATLAEADRIMRDHGYRHLPVVEFGGALVGLLADRDLLRAQAGGVPDDLPVARAMNSHVLTASPDTGIAECARMMLAWRISCVPVLSGPMRTVLGVVTNGDLLRAAVGDAPVDVWM